MTLEKPYFEPILVPFRQESAERDHFQEIRLNLFVQFHAKIQKISMSSSKEKLWTNRQMDSWYFIGRSHCGFKNKK